MPSIEAPNNAHQNDPEALRALAEVNALITDSHIVYTSGKHGAAYVNKDAIYPHAELTSRLCRNIAVAFAGDRIEVVIAPAVGGVILSQWTAFHLTRLERERGTGKEILGVYAEKNEIPGDDRFVIKRGYDRIVSGKRVLVVEDILTTGGSVRKVVEAVREAGGEVAGAAALCNRGAVSAGQVGGIPRLLSLVDLKLETWDEAECPLCARNVPINTQVGKGREYLARKQRI